MSSNVIFFVQIPFFSPFVQDVHFVHQVLPIPLVEFVVPLSKTYLNHHHLFLLPTNVGLRWLVQCSKVNSLHKVLLNHHSMPQFLVMMIQLGPLPSKKVFVLPVIHILFIIFLAITDCLLPIVLLYHLCPLLLFQKM